MAYLASFITGRTPFVGRQRELAELIGHLEAAQQSQGRIALVAGEPGIGKTRLVLELAERARAEGWQVLFGRACPLEALQAQLGDGAPEVALLVTELRNRLPDLPSSPARSPEAERYRLFQAVSEFFLNIANSSESRGLLLCLDDLHWADKPSLLLLQHLARKLAATPLLVLGSYRTVELDRTHPLSDLLAELSREHLYHHLLLASLSLEEAAGIIESLNRAPAAPTVVDAIYRETEGNPFFVEEVARHLQAEGRDLADSQAAITDWGIPEGVRQVIGKRLSRLSAGANRMLEAGGVLGEGFTFDVLASMSGIEPAPLMDALDEALRAGVVREESNGYHFTHALIRQTLYEELSLPRRQRLHLRAAEAIEAVHARNLEPYLADIAYHYWLAGTAAEPQKVIEYARRAADRALAVFAYEEAVRLCQMALETRDRKGAPNDAEGAALLAGLGQAQVSLGQYQEGMANLTRAFDYYARAGEIERAVDVAAHPVGAQAGRLPERGQLVRRALALAPPDSLAAGWLLSEQVRPLALEQGDYQGALEASQQAVAIARQQDDRALEARTLALTVSVHGYYRRYGETKQAGLQAIALAQAVDDPWSETLAGYWTCMAYLGTGDTLEAARLAQLALAAGQGRDAWLSGLGLLAHLSILSQQGAWDAAREFGDRALLSPGVAPPALRSRTRLEYQTGNLAQGEAFLERVLALATAPRPTPSDLAVAAAGLAMVAFTTGDTSRLDQAEAFARAVLASPPAPGNAIVEAHVALALAVVVRGDVGTAAEQYAALRTEKSTAVTTGDSVDRLLGLLCVTMGRLDQAVAHFEEALAFCRRAGFLPELAWTCHDCGVALLRRSSPGDRAKAMVLLDEALALSGELGMRPLVERLLRLPGRRRPAPERPAPTYPDGLTEREVEVLRLIAAGKSNSDIAEDLFLSIRTVERHIANVYGKIDARNKADATAYAFRHGLTSLP